MSLKKKKLLQTQQSCQHPKSYKRLGLPNIGNTCFINSVIQQFYNLEPFQNLLKNSWSFLYYQKLFLSYYSLPFPDNEPKSIVLQALGKIFRLMNNKQASIKQKVEPLKQMAEILQSKLNGYIIGSQHDSLDTFLCILNEGFDEKPELMNKFEIQYFLRCQCPGEPMMFKQIKIESQQNRCITCGSVFISQIKTYPQYLIIQGGDKNTNKLFIDKLQKNGIYYQFLSTNLYVGNGERGHYYSICKHQNQLLTVNDSQVSSYISYRGKMITSIYRKENEKSRKPICESGQNQILKNAQQKFIKYSPIIAIISIIVIPFIL